MNLEYLLLTSQQMRQADSNAIKRLGDGYELMRNAGKQVFDNITHRLVTTNFPSKILILCATGNNGGDGFVVAKHALEEGIETHVAIVGDISNISGDAKQAFDALPSKSLINSEKIQWEDYRVIVDALFGTGLERDIRGRHREIIEQANQTDALRVAVDIPSGVDSDSGKIRGIAFNAAMTITFFTAKPGHYLMPGKAYCGEVIVTDIGIEAQDLQSQTIHYKLNHPDNWQDKIPKPSLDQHKYHRGHTVIIGGESDATGASKLAALAALRAGSGLVSIACSKASLPIYASWATAVMTKAYEDEKQLGDILQHPKVNAIAYGMGAGNTEKTRQRTLALLKTGIACVLDADAISVFEGKLSDLKPHLHEAVVLTPHSGEFHRLFSDPISDEEGRLQQALQAAALTSCIIVLKGSDTIIASPEGRAFVNYTAPLHLATAGSGDVLAGIISGQLAQGIEPFEAAAIGVWMHSQAANRYKNGMIADDIIEGLLENRI